uniref:Uncharacterized protein n=1 Tax=Pyxicephalus adspersus TaxID=30357 RepID=A0AAV3AW10_PYXAD|nr:TPA: hypothetical protein GDO54_000888 [Pyxicephalus adspersus]
MKLGSNFSPYCRNIILVDINGAFTGLSAYVARFVTMYSHKYLWPSNVQNVYMVLLSPSQSILGLLFIIYHPAQIPEQYSNKEQILGYHATSLVLSVTLRKSLFRWSHQLYMFILMEKIADGSYFLIKW